MGNRGNGILEEVLTESRKLGKYDVGETVEGLARKLGKAPSEILKVNSNENYFVPLDFLRNVLKEVVEEVDPRIYPRDELLELKEAISKYMDVSTEEVVIGTGSDQLIDLISRTFLKSGDEALSIAPTFSIYERCVKIQGGAYKAVPLKEDFSLDTEKILASTTPRTKLLFLCSPNNPTANQFNVEDVQRLTENFGGIIAVDEAYADFAGFSLVNLVRRFENLVVFRTSSKVFGLAGLRLGYMVTNRELAKVIDERFQMPYSVSLIAVQAALKILRRIEVIRCAIEDMKAERSRLIRLLNQTAGVHAFNSETNFVLFQVNKDSREIYEALLKKGVILRNIGRVLQFEDCLRVTVAPHPMTERFLEALKKVLGEGVA